MAAHSSILANLVYIGQLIAESGNWVDDNNRMKNQWNKISGEYSGDMLLVWRLKTLDLERIWILKLHLIMKSCQFLKLPSPKFLTTGEKM